MVRSNGNIGLASQDWKHGSIWTTASGFEATVLVPSLQFVLERHHKYRCYHCHLEAPVSVGLLTGASHML